MGTDSTPDNSAVLTLRDRVVAERARYRLGEVTIEQVYSAVDEYTAACEAYARRRWPGRRFRRPSRAYLLRAL